MHTHKLYMDNDLGTGLTVAAILFGRHLRGPFRGVAPRSGAKDSVARTAPRKASMIVLDG
jgi:hypothetical protein